MSDSDRANPIPSSERSEAGSGSAARPSLMDDAKASLAGAAQSRKEGIADQIDGLAKTVHRAGSEFEGQQDWLARAIGQGAAELEGLASALRKKDLGEIVSDVRGFAERQPAIFIGAALAAGFALARFGKIAAGDLSKADLPTLREVGRE
jgi:hypothetical protein